jgi:hypothetical protein
MPSWFLENNTATPNDSAQRSLQKWNALLYAAVGNVTTPFPEGARPLPSDDAARSEKKINALLGGSSGGTPPAFPLAAPLSPSQFTLSDFGGGNIGYTPTGSQLAGFVICRYRGQFPDPWIDGLTIPTTGPGNVVEGLSVPSNYEVEVAWALNDGSPLSDWSVLQVVFLI